MTTDFGYAVFVASWMTHAVPAAMHIACMYAHHVVQPSGPLIQHAANNAMVGDSKGWDAFGLSKAPLPPGLTTWLTRLTAYMDFYITYYIQHKRRLHSGEAPVGSAMTTTDVGWCRWFHLLQQNTSCVPLVSLRDMNNKELPLCKPPADFNTPVLVVIGSNDAVVDLEAAKETAQHYGQQDVVELPDIAHDLMLVSATSASPCEVGCCHPQDFFC